MAVDCINYWGHVGKAGYGLDYEPKNQKTVLAHRKAYYDFNGEIPLGMVVRHICDNKKCVNPTHLVAGTQSENVKEAYERGLQVNPRRSMTKEQVLAIYTAEGSPRAIARLFNTTQTVVKNIRLNRTYVDITKGGVCGS